MLAADNGFYVGTFYHALDAKNRLTIPAKWRFPGDEQETSYLGLPNPSGCITMYPPEMMARIQEKIKGVSLLGGAAQLRPVTRLFARAERVGCDKQGRVGLSASLLEAVGLVRDTVLVGTITAFHIWEPKRYAQFLAENPEEAVDDTAVFQQFGL